MQSDEFLETVFWSCIWVCKYDKVISFFIIHQIWTTATHFAEFPNVYKKLQQKSFPKNITFAWTINFYSTMKTSECICNERKKFIVKALPCKGPRRNHCCVPPWQTLKFNYFFYLKNYFFEQIKLCNFFRGSEIYKRD